MPTLALVTLGEESNPKGDAAILSRAAPGSFPSARKVEHLAMLPGQFPADRVDEPPLEVRAPREIWKRMPDLNQRSPAYEAGGDDRAPPIRNKSKQRS